MERVFHTKQSPPSKLKRSKSKEESSPSRPQREERSAAEHHGEKTFQPGETTEKFQAGEVPAVEVSFNVPVAVPAVVPSEDIGAGSEIPIDIAQLLVSNITGQPSELTQEKQEQEPQEKEHLQPPQQPPQPEEQRRVPSYAEIASSEPSTQATVEQAKTQAERLLREVPVMPEEGVILGGTDTRQQMAGTEAERLYGETPIKPTEDITLVGKEELSEEMIRQLDQGEQMETTMTQQEGVSTSKEETRPQEGQMESTSQDREIGLSGERRYDEGRIESLPQEQQDITIGNVESKPVQEETGGEGGEQQMESPKPQEDIVLGGKDEGRRDLGKEEESMPPTMEISPSEAEQFLPVQGKLRAAAEEDRPVVELLEDRPMAGPAQELSGWREPGEDVDLPSLIERLPSEQEVPSGTQGVVNIPGQEPQQGGQEVREEQQQQQPEQPTSEQQEEPMETGQVAPDVPQDISAQEHGRVGKGDERPIVTGQQEYSEEASQIKTEVEQPGQGDQGEQPSEEQQQQQQPLRREDEKVPQVQVEGLEPPKQVSEEGEQQLQQQPQQPEHREESEEGLRRRLEDEGYLIKGEGIGARSTDTSGPTEEERRRLQRGAFIAENPVAGDVMEGQEKQPQPQPQQQQQQPPQPQPQPQQQQEQEGQVERREEKEETQQKEDICGQLYREGQPVPQMRLEGFGDIKTSEKEETKREEHFTPQHVEEVEKPTIEHVLEKLAEERGDKEPAELKEELKVHLIGEEREREVQQSEQDVQKLVESVKELNIGTEKKEEEQQQPREEKGKRKVCIILGAADWFGSECAKCILKSHKDWIVYLADRDETTGQDAIRRLNDDFGLEARFHPLEATSMVSLRNFRDFLIENHQERDGGIHLLISNIGLMANVSPLQGGSPLDKATFEDTIRSAYFGTLQTCMELLPLMNDDDGRVILVSSRFAQAAFMHSTPELQERFRVCHKVEQVNELMELILSSDLATIQNSYMRDPQSTSIYGNYTLGDIYAYGIASMGLNLLVQCYQRQLEEDKAGKRVAINAVCPGLERPDKSLGEAVDTIEWLALEQAPDSGVRGQFVADRKIIDHFVISSEQQLL